jgi:hypothetical protein
VVASRDLETAQTDMDGAGDQMSEIRTTTLELFNRDERTDVGTALCQAISSTKGELNRLRRTGAALYQARIKIRATGVKGTDSHLEIWPLGPAFFEVPPEHRDRVQQHSDQLRSAAFTVQSAQAKLGAAKKAILASPYARGGGAV